ncbi:Gfo/Idh/MocA family oxidoreductase [Candidatus Poribacteria bacterium]|nr:Gfo/Idh/MocA family oxidoreductase [Candidatus Poribacteria bacterium]
MNDKKIRCAIIGYGTTYTWGWMHALWIKGVEDLNLVAICDQNPTCAEKAKEDFPAVDIYTTMHEMLNRDDIDMVSVVTHHNTHASIVVECLNAGKHVVVEKPMCIRIAEATEMIETAKKVNRTLAVFHNRRHDGNVRAIKEVIEQGKIGDVFHIELSACGYGRPGNWWRSQKEISGGVLYDWGSHAIDWVLSMVPSKMVQVTGFSHKLVWHDFSNEDQARAIILFENGVVADITQSNIAYVGKPLWRILGTKGAIVDTGRDAIKGYIKELIGPPGGSFKMVTAAGEMEVNYKESDWITYYVDMANHLRHGTPVPVSGEDGRRVITVLETAEKSAKSGHSENVPYQ